MDHVLDLKNPEVSEAPDEGTTTDVQAPATVDLPQTEPGQSSAVALGLAAAALLAGPEEIAWEAHHALPEHTRTKRYLAMAVLAVAGGLVAWWQASWLTVGVVVLGLGAWELRERHGTPTQVRITRTGVWVDDTHYPHADVASFDLHRMPDDSVHVSIRTNRRLTPHLRIPLGNQDPTAVHALLSRYVPESKHPISLIDWWLRKK